MFADCASHFKGNVCLFKNALLVVLGFIISVLPWTYRNHLVLNRLVLVSTNSGVNMYVGNATTFANKLRQGDCYYEMIRAQGDGYEQGKILNKRGIEFLLNNIKNDPQKFLKKLKYHFDPFLAYKIKISNKLETISKYNWMYVFLVPFIIFGFKSQLKNKFIILSAFFLSMNTVTALIYQGAVRYRLIIEPLLIIVGVMGITKFVDRSFFRFSGMLFWLLINGLIGIFFPTEFPKLLMNFVPGSDAI